MCCYISKSEDYVMNLASDTQIYTCIKKQLDFIEEDRHTILHSIIAMSSALIDDKTTRNAEIAHDKWGADMEGFKLLEQLRAKVSQQTPTLVSKYSKAEIEKSGVKMRLLKDLGVPGLLSEYFSNLKSTKMAAQSEENIMNFLLMISEEKKYRPYIVNKGIIDYLKNLFDSHGGSKVRKSKVEDPDKKARSFFSGVDKNAERMKEKIDKLVSRIGCHVNPQSLSYNLQHFIFDILCHAVENSAHELTIFESLMG